MQPLSKSCFGYRKDFENSGARAEGRLPSPPNHNSGAPVLCCSFPVVKEFS